MLVRRLGQRFLCFIFQLSPIMSRRLDRINELFRREIGAILQKDYEWHGRLVTVSDVEVTQDLKEGKVWISVLGGDHHPVLEKLNKEHGAIQSKVMKRVVLKATPVLVFRHDSSAGRGVDIVNLLQEVDKLPKAPEEDPSDEPK
jgi:ribosome-binding factor A